MNFELTDEQDAIRSTARELLERRLPSEKLRPLLDEERNDAALWDEVATLGWPGLAVSEEHGGQGLATIELVLLCEELGRSLAPLPLLANAAAGILLASAGSAEQQERYLPGIASGEAHGAVAIVRDGIGRLTVDAEDAAVLILVDGDRAFIAGPATVVVPERSIDASRRYSTVQGSPGESLPGSARAGLDRVAVLVAAELVGVAQRALELAVDYAGEREQFGRKIGTFQGVSHRCARMLLETEKARAVTLYAAWAADNDPDALPLAASVAKAAASKAAVRVASDSLQVHGGIGFTWEADVHLLLKRARASAQLLGAPAEHRARIAALRREAMLASAAAGR